MYHHQQIFHNIQLSDLNQVLLNLTFDVEVVQLIHQNDMSYACIIKKKSVSLVITLAENKNKWVHLNKQNINKNNLP